MGKRGNGRRPLLEQTLDDEIPLWDSEPLTLDIGLEDDKESEKGGRGRGKAKGRGRGKRAERSIKLDSETEKPCTKCRKRKPLSEFNKDQGKCKKCHNIVRGFRHLLEVQLGKGWYEDRRDANLCA